MKPKLKEHVFFAPTDDGVLFKGPSGTLLLRGARLYEWIEKLLPYLQGAHHLEQIVGGLSPDRRKMVGDLIQQLADRGFVKDMAADEPHELAPWELERYADAIRFIEDWQPSPTARFERFRNVSIALVGQGDELVGLVRGLLQTGLRHLVTWTGADDPIHERLAREVARHQKGDPDFTWAAQALPAAPDWATLLTPYDVIALAGGSDLQPLAASLAAVARAGGKLFLSGLEVAGTGWVGPLVAPGTTGCWRCATERLQALPTERPAAPWSPTAGLILGHVTAFELFKELTGALPAMSREALLQVDPDHLSVTQRAITPWPLCTSCGTPPPADLAALLAEWQDRPPLTMAEAWKEAEPLISPVTGLLARVDQEALVQLPLAQCAALLRLPGAPRVVAAGQNHDQARYGALRLGLERYARDLALLLGDHQGMISSTGQLHPDRSPLDLPFTAGHTRAEWIGRGLIALAERRAAAALQAGEAKLTPIHLGELTPWHHLLWKTVTIRYGLPLALYQVASERPHTLLALIHGEQVLALVAERSPSAALERGLIQIIHPLQNAEPLIPVAHATHSPPITTNSERQELDLISPPPAWEEWTPEVVAALQAQGRSLLLRPFTTDPAVARAGLLTGWVGLEER